MDRLLNVIAFCCFTWYAAVICDAAPPKDNPNIHTNDEVVKRTRFGRYLMDQQQAVRYMSEQQRVACATTCIELYRNITLDCCHTGNNKLCYDVPVDVLKIFVGLCPVISPTVTSAFPMTVLPTGPTSTVINNIIQQLFCRNVDSVICSQDFSIVCGSDGQFYQNSCELSKAKCWDITLTVEPDSTKCTGPVISATVTTVFPTITASPMTTGSPMTTASQETTVLPTGPTTTVINNLIQQLFCRNVDSVICSQDFSIVCGSDGQFYPNSCELSKAKCRDITLTAEHDATKCTSPGRK